jgi:type VI secretion system VasD/TssJ family lipoprotein
MWQCPAEVLGDALVSEETLVVHPGAEVRRQLRAAEEATHLAAVVIVREPAGRTWRALAPIERIQGADEACAASTQRITFRLDGYRIEAVARLTEEASP